MTDFEKAHEFTALWEGGYVNHNKYNMINLVNVRLSYKALHSRRL